MSENAAVVVVEASSLILVRLCFFITSFSLVLISNKEYKKESIIDSSEDSIIDRLDLIPEEFDVEKQDDKEGLSVPSD